MYFRNAKIFGEFVGAQGVDVGIDPYAQFGKLQIKTQKNTLHEIMQRVLIGNK